MNWTVFVGNRAGKNLKRFPKHDQENIRFALRQFAVNPSTGDIEKMEGERDVWRRRIGAYRIKYEVRQAQRLVYVFEIKRRTSTTY